MNARPFSTVFSTATDVTEEQLCESARELAKRILSEVVTPACETQQSGLIGYDYTTATLALLAALHALNGRASQLMGDEHFDGLLALQEWYVRHLLAAHVPPPESQQASESEPS